MKNQQVDICRVVVSGTETLLMAQVHCIFSDCQIQLAHFPLRLAPFMVLKQLLYFQESHADDNIQRQ